MPIQKKQNKTTRRRHSPEFNDEALGFAEQVGVSGAAKQAGELEILKKGKRVLCEKPEVKYAFMTGNTGKSSISSGYYAWRRRQDHPSRGQLFRGRLDRLVLDVSQLRKGRSGTVGLALDLDEMGRTYNRKTVAARVKWQGLVAKAAKKFKATTDSDHDRPVAPNLLRQDFSAKAPNEKWVCDITYLWNGEGWLYLAVVLELFSRMVVGRAMDKCMKAELVCDALQMAHWRRRRPKGVIVHSDSGSRYRSKKYQALLARHDFICGMSGKGNCYDNAVAESFFHTLKVETIHGEDFAPREAMRRTVFEYIEVDYNRTRRHSANGYISPLAFENKMVA